MAPFFTADLHLGHANIIEYTHRPYRSVEDMNDDLVDRWNTRVGPADIVWVLGDVALGNLDESLEYVGLLNGEKHLVPGNHDRVFRCEGAKYARASERYLDAGFVEVHEPQVSLAIPTDRPGIQLSVTACHFPYMGDSKDGHEDRFQDHRPKDRGGYLVHGHVHGSLGRKSGRMIDVGVDAWGGYPVAAETIAVWLTAGQENLDRLPWLPREEGGAS